MNDRIQGIIGVNSGTTVAAHSNVIYPSQAHIITSPAAAGAPATKPIPPKLMIMSQLMKNPISTMFAAGLATQVPRLFSNKPMDRKEFFGRKN